MASGGKIKGAAFGEFVAWYGRHVDAAGLRTAVAELEGRYPGTFDPARERMGLLTSHWYEAQLVHELLDELVRGKSEAQLDDMAERASDEIMGKTLSGIYRFIFSTLATPERYAKHAGRLWDMHYDSGRIVIERAEADNTWRSRISDWGAHHEFICRLNMAATVPIYRTMGCQGVSYRRIACVAQGAAACETLVHYDSE